MLAAKVTSAITTVSKTTAIRSGCMCSPATAMATAATIRPAVTPKDTAAGYRPVISSNKMTANTSAPAPAAMCQPPGLPGIAIAAAATSAMTEVHPSASAIWRRDSSIEPVAIQAAPMSAAAISAEATAGIHDPVSHQRRARIISVHPVSAAVPQLAMRRATSALTIWNCSSADLATAVDGRSITRSWRSVTASGRSHSESPSSIPS
ncbi:Uncharacterised protein [Mycobacteroides abscessus subsp. abscessus]|nr:Uncharacterised protein [Mycobacteroides abscessus subsp. abscessus]